MVAFGASEYSKRCIRRTVECFLLRKLLVLIDRHLGELLHVG